MQIITGTLSSKDDISEPLPWNASSTPAFAITGTFTGARIVLESAESERRTTPLTEHPLTPVVYEPVESLRWEQVAHPGGGALALTGPGSIAAPPTADRRVVRLRAAALGSGEVQFRGQFN